MCMDIILYRCGEVQRNKISLEQQNEKLRIELEKQKLDEAARQHKAAEKEKERQLKRDMEKLRIEGIARV